ncbi:MAG: hypothetical protein WA941_06080 [Nitrososphaeraceae archaeon]
MSSTSTKFPDTNELKRFARNYLHGKISALQKDVNHCLQPPYAPFPAILYCLATIDLLGALCAGKVLDWDPTTKKRIYIDTTGNSKSYMELFMGYTDQQSQLIIKLYRHKLVHLAQPNPIYIDDKTQKRITWEYSHEHRNDHLYLHDAPKDSKTWIKPDWVEEYHQVFTIGIRQLMEDIIDSVIRHGGYLDKLETDTFILDNFRTAIEEAYKV